MIAGGGVGIEIQRIGFSHRQPDGVGAVGCLNVKGAKKKCD
jgi:hypothetical protein